MPLALSRIGFTIVSFLFLLFFFGHPARAFDADEGLSWASDVIEKHTPSLGSNPDIKDASKTSGKIRELIGLNTSILKDIDRIGKGENPAKVISGMFAKHTTNFIMRGGVSAASVLAAPYCVNPIAAAGCAALFASANSYAGKLSNAYREWTESFFDESSRPMPVLGNNSGVKVQDYSTARRSMESVRNFPQEILDDDYIVNFEAEEAEPNSDPSTILSYGWDDKTGQYVWKVDGKVVDESHPEVQKFCSDPSKNCPQPGSQSETSAIEQEPATEAPAEDLYPQPAPSVETAATGADPGAIGGMQSAGGNPVVQPGNSIWHGEGGFQGEEYDNNGLNGKSNINQFKLWDSDDLAPQAGSDVQQRTATAERVIDQPVPRGSVYMPDEKYTADTNADYGSDDANSSSFSPSSNSSSQSSKNRNSNRNQRYKPRNSRCSGGMSAPDYSTPFPQPCF